jgi:uncharacterized delta-60 repeat protein
LASLLLATPSVAQHGTLDPGFSDDGVATYGFGITNTFGRKVIQQPDGRILVAGNTFAFGVSAFGAARLLENGDLDLSWDTVGYTITSFSTYDAAFDMALQDDGKVVLIGHSDNGSSGIGVVRYTDMGLPDPGFGTNGSTVINIPGQSLVEAYCVAVQPNGGIVVCGMAYDGTGRVFIARLATDGSLDPTFGTGGLALITNGEYSVGYDVLVRSDGRILVGGYTETASDADYLLAQVNSDGSPDDSFGTNGVVTSNFGNTWERIQGIATDPDNAIVCTGAAGTGFDFATFDAVVLRYLANGTLDTSFDADGRVLIDHAADGDGGEEVALQPDGKILICGAAGVAGQDEFALWRLLPTGAMDATFGTDGTVITPMGSEGGYAASVALQSDGRILAAGHSAEAFGSSVAVARYTSGLEVGIAAEAATNSIAVYPNPATERITISTAVQGSAVLEVIDTEGRVVLQQRLAAAGPKAVDVRGLAEGRYVLHMRTADARYVGAFVKGR